MLHYLAFMFIKGMKEKLTSILMEYLSTIYQFLL